jgi:YbbR domain-containing protein
MNSDNKSILRFVPGFIRHDFWRKFIALFFAVLIWARVAAQLGDEQIFRDLPVEITIPTGYVAVDAAPVTTDITLKGSKQRLLRLNPKDINVSFRIDKPICGENKLTITKKNVTLPPGVSVERIERKRFVLRLDRKAVKKVPVRLNITGALLDDYTYAVDTLIPSEILVSGPETKVKRIKEIQAAPIALGKVNVEDFECALRLKTPSGVTLSPKTVTVKVDIFKKYDTRTFESLTIKPFGFPPKNSRSLDFDVKTVSVRVAGLKQAVEVLTGDDLHPFVDISKVDKPGEYTLSVQCWVGVENVFVKEIKPGTIQVTIR